MERNIHKKLKKFNRYKKQLSAKEAEIAEKLYIQLIKTEKVSKEDETHCYNRIFPMIAVYKSLNAKDEDKLDKAKLIFWQADVYPRLNISRKVFKLPFVNKLIPRLANKVTKAQYPEGKGGFQMEFLETSKRVFRFNIKQCTYFNYCKKHGVPELCTIFCDTDDLTAAAMKPNIVFQRENTIAKGGQVCDFCYRISEDK